VVVVDVLVLLDDVVLVVLLVVEVDVLVVVCGTVVEVLVVVVDGAEVVAAATGPPSPPPPHAVSRHAPARVVASNAVAADLLPRTTIVTIMSAPAARLQTSQPQQLVLAGVSAPGRSHSSAVHRPRPASA
jgi:hypothetical protein